MKTTKNQDVAIHDEKKLSRSVLKAMAVIGLVLLSVMQVMAMATDTILTGLEATFKSSDIQYSKTQENLAKAKEMVDLSRDTRCSAYKALKSYKETKNIKLADPLFNPCTEGEVPASEPVATFPQPETSSQPQQLKQ
jgi:hypothetical protein